jgi:hypothetical protein
VSPGARLVAAALVACAACGEQGPVDLSGTYRVQSHEASMCSTDQPVPMPIAYLRVSSGPPYAIDACAGTDDTTCTPFASFPDQVDGGWRRGAASVLVNTELAACDLTFLDATALRDDDTLSVETTTYVDRIAADSPVCTEAEAARRGLKMPCNSHELIVAARLMLP